MTSLDPALMRCPACERVYELDDDPPGSIAIHHAPGCAAATWTLPVVLVIGEGGVPSVAGHLFWQPGECKAERLGGFLRAAADAIDAYHAADHARGSCRAGSN